MEPGAVSPESAGQNYKPTRAAGYFRWVICALLLLGTTKNYMDRQVISVLKPTLQHELGWSEIDYGNIVLAFQIAYALGMLAMGRLVDRLGTRVGYAVAMVLWSLASMAHGLASSLTGFLAARFGLGFGEAGVFPASLKAAAEWFPKKERALAAGIFNAGTNIGAATGPLLVAWIFVHWGWRASFYMVGGLGFAWLALWLIVYRRPEEHPWVSAGELEHIRRDREPISPKVPWSRLFLYRQTWAFAIGKFLIDPIWWFYLFWIPDFLKREHGLDLLHVGVPLFVIYVIGDAGSVGGGWLSSSLIHRGRSVNSARKIAMLVCALAAVPIMSAPFVRSSWAAILLLGLASAAHQGFSSNVFTLPSDMFPSKAVGSVVGIGGMFGAIGGGLIAVVVSHILQWTGSYTIPFLIAGSGYLVALAAIHLLAPQLDPAPLEG